jgi:hypothetical protein
MFALCQPLPGRVDGATERARRIAAAKLVTSVLQRDAEARAAMIRAGGVDSVLGLLRAAQQAVRPGPRAGRGMVGAAWLQALRLRVWRARQSQQGRWVQAGWEGSVQDCGLGVGVGGGGGGGRPCVVRPGWVLLAPLGHQSFRVGSWRLRRELKAVGLGGALGPPRGEPVEQDSGRPGTSPGLDSRL